MLSARVIGAMFVVGIGMATLHLPVSQAVAEFGTANRESVIERSKVWMPTDIPSMDLKAGPAGPGSFAMGETVTCDYVNRELGGASPKFACLIGGNDEVKVKYGGSNGEVYAEVAASRLLWALGFGADRMYPVRVVCRGCPEDVGGTLTRDGARLLDPATIERKIGDELYGSWKWDELALVDERRGGATRAERDALTLLAVLLQHSDSKSDNQRIVCMDPAPRQEGVCRTPMMFVQDIGISFGRAHALNRQPLVSMHLERWLEVPVWKDSGGCIGKLSGSIHGTLEDPYISEAGRKFLADLLAQLSDEQLTGMFQAARVTLRPRVPGSGSSGFPSTQEWVRAFRQKQAQIVARRCT